MAVVLIMEIQSDMLQTKVIPTMFGITRPGNITDGSCIDNGSSVQHATNQGDPNLQLY